MTRRDGTEQKCKRGDHTVRGILVMQSPGPVARRRPRPTLRRGCTCWVPMNTGDHGTYVNRKNVTIPQNGGLHGRELIVIHCIQFASVPFSSVHDGIYALGTAHVRSTPSLTEEGGGGVPPTLSLKQVQCWSDGFMHDDGPFSRPLNY